jgi:hypothetical protein
MTSTVTLRVFSGLPNPTWQLTPQQDDELSQRLAAADAVTSTRPSGVLGGLGYRGFSISRAADHAQGPMTLHVHEGVIDRGFLQPNVTDPVLETWLAGTGANAMHPDVQSYVASRIALKASEPFTHGLAAPAHCPQNHAHDAPPYQPGKWNIPTVQPYNNCYNYANDHITNTFAQPGRAHGKQATQMACGPVETGAIADGLKPVANFHAPLAAGHGWYVALVIWPNVDYHWYRQDNVGCWSHKPGSTAARNWDNANQPISDPKTCNRGPYTVFCTYMVTTRHVVIR